MARKLHDLVSRNFECKAVSVSSMRVSVRVSGVSKIGRLGEARVAMNFTILVMELLDLFHGELLDNRLHSFGNEFPFAHVFEVGFFSNHFDLPIDRDDLFNVL